MENKKRNGKRYRRGKRRKKRSSLPIFVIVAVLMIVIVVIIAFNSVKNSEDKKKEAATVQVLEPRSVDASVLQNLIDSAENIETEGYAEESVNAFTTALEDAKALLKTDYDKPQLSEACKILVDAIQNLK